MFWVPVRSYEPSKLCVVLAPHAMQECDEFLVDIHDDPIRGHRAASFAVGDWVWLRLCHHAPIVAATTVRPPQESA